MSNTYDVVTITIKKVSKENLSDHPVTLLYGATFKITKFKDENYHSIVTDWETEGSKTLADVKVEDEYTLKGVFTFTNLPEGYYEIEETVSPNGYINLLGKPRFEIKRNSTSGKTEIYLIEPVSELVRLVDGELTLIIGNEPGTVLPHTGGPGTRIFAVLGSILILGAGLLLWRR